MPKPLLTALDVAQRLQVSRRSAYRLMREMGYVELTPGTLRVTEQALQEFIRNRSRPGWGAAPQRKGSGQRGTAPEDTGTLRAWLRPITPRIKPTPPADDDEELTEEQCERLRLLAAERLAKMRARERERKK